MFATHSRAGMDSIQPLLHFKGKQRPIVIDEALHKSEAFGIRTHEFRQALNWVTEEIGGGSLRVDLNRWADQLLEEFEVAVEMLKATKRGYFSGMSSSAWISSTPVCDRS